MSTHLTQADHENLKLKHIETQFESWRLMHTFLETIQRHHLLCAEASDDVEIARIHTKIAYLINQTRNQYVRLLKNSRRHSN